MSKPCTLSGNNLFLATAIAATPEFENPIEVPPDFTETQLIVPHPTGGVLYMKLRDDPATVQTWKDLSKYIMENALFIPLVWQPQNQHSVSQKGMWRYKARRRVPSLLTSEKTSDSPQLTE